MAKRKAKKARDLRTHAYVRAAQRLGICLDAEEQTAIVQDIQANRCQFVERQSRHKTVWNITFKEQSFNVVYDSRFKSLVTILP